KKKKKKMENSSAEKKKQKTSVMIKSNLTNELNKNKQALTLSNAYTYTQICFIKKDLYAHWTLTNEEISQFMAQQSKYVRHLEVSLKDCFGIKELHTFLSVPFLRMKVGCKTNFNRKTMPYLEHLFCF
ncbi:hypothetical protein RFI_33373, partial [Reticulomyxa filosa]